MVNKNQFSSNVRITPFGGVANVTKNMFVYSYQPVGQPVSDILIIDCGIGFPDEPDPKEELLLPDFSYLKQNKDKIRGLIVTHAHFDHYGAVPNLLLEINVPIWTSALTKEFIIKKLEETKVNPKFVDFHLINGQTNEFSIGAFKVTPFHINHSVPQALGFLISTPRGNIFHISDFKFDWTPIDEKPFDIQKVSYLASQKKPVLLLSDSLGAAKEGHTKTEIKIQEVLENIMIRAKNLVLVTTISSNISRIKQAIMASINTGRKVAFLGRSLEASSQIALKLGYFSSLKKHLIPIKKIKSIPFSQLTIIVAGSYGQEDSALSRISKNKHSLIKLRKGDVVIFSADPAPPGVIIKVNNMVDNLTRLKARVYYYEIQDNLHVSGHATAEDLKMLIALIKPQYLMPIGGDYRHMNAYSLFAQKMGYSEKQILLLKEKQTLEINVSGRLLIKNG